MTEKPFRLQMVQRNMTKAPKRQLVKLNAVIPMDNAGERRTLVCLLNYERKS